LEGAMRAAQDQQAALSSFCRLSYNPAPMAPKQKLHRSTAHALALRALEAEKWLKSLADQIRSEIDKRKIDLYSGDPDTTVALPRWLVRDLIYGMDVTVHGIRFDGTVTITGGS
jgi:hypothetical protein